MALTIVKVTDSGKGSDLRARGHDGYTRSVFDPSDHSETLEL